MSNMDEMLTSIVERAQRLFSRKDGDKLCTLEPSENMQKLWDLNPDLDRETILHEYQQRQRHMGRKSQGGV